MLFFRNIQFVFLSLLLNSFAMVGWSDDDGTCDISDFLCPVPEDLSFSWCNKGLGHGTMTMNHLQCSVTTYPHNYNKTHSDIECKTEGKLCGIIHCPSDCNVGKDFETCKFRAWWRLCDRTNYNQSTFPPHSFHTCGQEAIVNQLSCKDSPTLPTIPHTSLNTLDWCLITGAALSAVLIITICGIAVGRYFYRNKDYQPIQGGININPPQY